MSESLALKSLDGPSLATDSSPRRIRSLDGWRGIAILLVLIDHAQVITRFSANPQRPFWLGLIGQHGVAIFFVLSGYLITRILSSEREQTGRINLRSFYVRRFYRLMPCAFLFLVAAAAVGLPRGLVTPLDLLGCLLSFRNYVPAHPGSLFTSHFWSLSIEEQFYFVWPTTLAVFGLRRSRWIACAGALTVALLRASTTFHSGDQTQFTQFHADTLLVGCLAALLRREIVPYLRRWMALPLLAGLAYSIFAYQPLIPLQESCVIAALILVTSELGALGAVLEFAPLKIIGVLSYSLYIWQEFFLMTAASAADLIWAAPMLAAVAFASYQLIERPFIERGRKYSNDKAMAVVAK